MARPRVKLDLKGLEAAATTPEMTRAVEDVAREIAENVEAQGIKVAGGKVDLPVKVYVDTTADMRVNRARATVVLAHAAGMAVQAKHGSLTRAASEAGLKVKGD